MSGTPYNGLAGNIAFSGTINISSSSNTTPVVVQTAAAHGCMTGDQVEVAGHQTNVFANGIWTVTVVDSTHLSLNGSAAGGAGGATGTVQPLSFTGNVSLNPANGDPYDASTYIPGMSCLADRTAWLGAKTGRYSVASVIAQTVNASESNSSYGSASGVFNAYVSASATGGSPFVSFSGAEPGDLILMTYSTTVFAATTGAALNYFVALMTSTFSPGGVAGAFTKVGGSNQCVQPGTFAPVTLRGAFSVGGPGSGITIDVVPGFYCNGASAPGGTFSLDGDAYFEAIILRPTGKPQ